MIHEGKRPQEAENQDSPGVLKDERTGRFNTTRQDIAELPVTSIQQCPLIPEYKDPTESTLPMVVHTPEAFVCIDGWNLVDQARAEGQTTVRCHVYQIQEHSDTELALRKAAIRTKPVGGTCCYAERVRNTKLLAELLMDEMENPTVFSHGGGRRGANFTNNREDDLREVLSERLGKDRNTINSYLNYGRFLTNEIMEMLVAQNTGRAFFEKALVNKRFLIKNLESEGLDRVTITNRISTKILDWYKEYQDSGDIKTDFGETERSAETAATATEEEGDPTTASPSASTSTDADENRSEEGNTFNHKSPDPGNKTPVMPKIEDVTPLIQTAVESLSSIFDQTTVNYDQAIETIDEQIRQLATARQMLADIKNRSAKEEA